MKYLNNWQKYINKTRVDELEDRYADLIYTETTVPKLARKAYPYFDTGVTEAEVAIKDKMESIKHMLSDGFQYDLEENKVSFVIETNVGLKRREMSFTKWVQKSLDILQATANSSDKTGGEEEKELEKYEKYFKNSGYMVGNMYGILYTSILLFMRKGDGGQLYTLKNILEGSPTKMNYIKRLDSEIAALSFPVDAEEIRSLMFEKKKLIKENYDSLGIIYLLELMKSKDKDDSEEKKIVIFSKHPIDVARMSDFDGDIDSCHSPGDSYFKSAIQAATRGEMICYIVNQEEFEKHTDLFETDIWDEEGNIDVDKLNQDPVFTSKEIFRDPCRDRSEGLWPMTRLRFLTVTRNDLFRRSGQSWDDVNKIYIPYAADSSVYGKRLPGVLKVVSEYAAREQEMVIPEIFNDSEVELVYTGGDYKDEAFVKTIETFLDFIGKKDVLIKALDAKHDRNTSYLNSITAALEELMEIKHPESLSDNYLEFEMEDDEQGNGVAAEFRAKISFDLSYAIPSQDIDDKRKIAQMFNEYNHSIDLPHWDTVDEVSIENGELIISLSDYAFIDTQEESMFEHFISKIFERFKLEDDYHEQIQDFLVGEGLIRFAEFKGEITVFNPLYSMKLISEVFPEQVANWFYRNRHEFSDMLRELFTEKYVFFLDENEFIADDYVYWSTFENEEDSWFNIQVGSSEMWKEEEIEKTINTALIEFAAEVVSECLESHYLADIPEEQRELLTKKIGEFLQKQREEL